MSLVAIVDDDMEILRGTNKYLTGKGHSVETYWNTNDLIKRLENSAKKPEAYFVDMQLRGDLEGPEKLFYYLKERGQTNGFYFMTGHVSEHDKGVIDRTKAPCLEKGFHTVDVFIDILTKIDEAKPK